MKRRDFTALMLSFGAVGCDLFKDKKQALPGERIPVLGVGGGVEPDPKLAGTPVNLPAPTTNADWPQAGGNPAHLMGHLSLPDTVSRAWETRVGDGSARYTKVASQPIVVGGRV